MFDKFRAEFLRKHPSTRSMLARRLSRPIGVAARSYAQNNDGWYRGAVVSGFFRSLRGNSIPFRINGTQIHRRLHFRALFLELQTYAYVDREEREREKMHELSHHSVRVRF